MQISKEQLQPIKNLYDNSMYLAAHEAATALAPMSEWEGPDALLMAGRLAGNLGAIKLGRKYHQRAWRLYRKEPEVIYYHARAIWEMRGPWRVWMFMRSMDELHTDDKTIRADWLCLRADIFSTFRDFDAAEELIARAEALTPDYPWFWVSKASLLQAEDRYDAALEAVKHGLSLNPDYRPSLQTAAHLLSLIDREDEAVELLAGAAARLESAPICAQLAQLQYDLEDYSAARENLQRGIDLSVLAEPEMLEWFNGRLSDVIYLADDIEASVGLAKKAGEGFYKTVSERLRNGIAGKRRAKLAVGFIRQHHVTCAPATMTMIGRYWQVPVDHLGVVEQICYGGTSDHSERKWAEQNGWQAREFCVNWEDTVKLIDRGVPFALTTIDPGNGHLQAIIGYDERRGTILIRDPYNRSLGEALIPEFLDHYRATGPRGMLMVPKDKAGLLEGLELKDAALYDQLHGIQHALGRHRRDEASEIWQQMATQASDHRLTLYARLAIAWYDDDLGQALSFIERLLALYPADANLKMQKISCLRTLARHSERLKYLKAISAEEKADPYFQQQLAVELSEDSRQHRRALRMLHRSLRARPTEPSNFHALANIRWAQRNFDEALALYRFAACLKETEEHFVRSYFIAARHLRRREEAFKFLTRRFERFGRRSGAPARTLSWAYEQVGQAPEALSILRKGMELRPDDGELMVYAADAFARYGDFEQAGIWLRAAEGKAGKTQIMRTAASIANYRGELRESLAMWQRVHEAEPLAMDANNSIAQLLAETESQERAVEFLRKTTDRFPHYFPLHQSLLEWIRDDYAATEAALRHAIEIEPANSWARREMAFTLTAMQKHEEALEQAVMSRDLEPDNAYSHCAIGTVHADMGNFTMARQVYREAIRLSADNRYAIQELMRHSHTPAERRESLEYIGNELKRQETQGEGVLGYRAVAREVLDAADVLTLLQTALDARPDLWQTWSAVVFQLMDMQQLDQALELAVQATERFPLMPRVWLDLAAVHQARLDQPEILKALEQARRINPAWSAASQQMAEVYQRAGDFEKARKVIEQAIAYSPLDSGNYGYLAEIIWQEGQRENALEKIRHAVTLNPGYDWGWRMLRSWAQTLGMKEFALECARSLATKRPGQARSWLVLAQTDGQDLSDRIMAAEKAIEISPRFVEAHDLRTRLLVKAKRYDEARRACRPEIFGATPPPELQCTEALVEAEYGDTRAAVRKLEALVEVEPHYFQAWNLLADWYRNLPDPAKYMRAAKEMTRLEPHRAIPLGYLGEAQLANNARAEAKISLRRAMTLDPTYEFAGATLFDLQLQDYELSQAEETLSILRQQIGGDSALICELKLAGKRKDFDDAQKLFRQLCLSSTADVAQLREAMEADMEIDWNAIVDKVLAGVVDLPNVNPNVRAIVADRSVKHGDWDRAAAHLEKIPVSDDLWPRVVNSYLEGLAKAGKKSQFWSYLSDHREALRANDQTWGHVGYVFYSFIDRNPAIEWLSDWRGRSHVEAWMLWNLAMALRDLNRDRESEEVCRFALSLPPDNLSPVIGLMVAYDEWMKGPSELATGILRDIEAASLRDWDRMLWGIVTALGAYRDPAADTDARFGRAIDDLLNAASESRFFDGDLLLLRLQKEAVDRVAKEKDDYMFWAVARLRLGWRGFWADLFRTG